MNLAAFALGLIFGLLRKGRFASILKKHFRWPVLLLSLLLDVFRSYPLLQNTFGEANWYPILRIALTVLQYSLMLAFLFRNYAKPGTTCLMIGTLMNGIVIVANSGMMPISSQMLEYVNPDQLAAAVAKIAAAPHYFMGNDNTPLLFLGDIIPVWFFGWNMISLGDLLIFTGLFRLGAYLPKRILRPRIKTVEHPDDFRYTEGR